VPTVSQCAERQKSVRPRPVRTPRRGLALNGGEQAIGILIGFSEGRDPTGQLRMSR